jgi:hypothetical protein
MEVAEELMREDWDVLRKLATFSKIKRQTNLPLPPSIYKFAMSLS